MSVRSDNISTLHPLNRAFEWKPVVGPFRRITQAQARSFNENGFFVLEDAIDRETVARVIAEIDPREAKMEEFVRAQPGKRMMIYEANGISFTIHLVRHSQFLREFSASQVFADLCHDLIGPDVRLYWDQAVYKKPEYPKHFPWHQDNGYTFHRAAGVSNLLDSADRRHTRQWMSMDHAGRAFARDAQASRERGRLLLPRG
jgi:hypothetical protein